MATPTCSSCGAPDDGEFVNCKFCQKAISAELLASAIPCPRCRAACRWGKQKCGACGSWIVVSCVFCGALSPHNQSACLACQEPFQGAIERKQARTQQVQHQQNMQTAGVVGNIGASFLGAVAGAALTNSFYHHGDGDSSSWTSETDDFVVNTNESDSGGSDWGGDSGDSGGGWDEG